jgi:tetratricopeptide (TPR) repeat protein
MKHIFIICAGVLSSLMAYAQQDELLSANFHENGNVLKGVYETQPENKLTEEAWQLINKGIELNQTEDFQGAIKEFDKAIKMNSEIAQAYDYRAVCYIKLGKYRKAVNDLEEAIDLDNNFVDAYNHLGVANYWLKNYVDAISYYTRAISLNPSYATPYFNRAIVYLVLEDNDLALKDLNVAKSMNLVGVEPVIQQFFADKK